MPIVFLYGLPRKYSLDLDSVKSIDNSVASIEAAIQKQKEFVQKIISLIAGVTELRITEQHVSVIVPEASVYGDNFTLISIVLFPRSERTKEVLDRMAQSLVDLVEREYPHRVVECIIDKLAESSSFAKSE